MQATAVIELVLHVLSGGFWSGTTFSLARLGGNQASYLLRPQPGAAAIAVVTGALLWYLLHRGSEGTSEYVLAIGAVSALFAPGAKAATGAAGRPVLAGVADLQGSPVQNR